MTSHATTALWTVYNTFCVLIKLMHSYAIVSTSSPLSPMAEVRFRRCCWMQRGHAVMKENAHFSSPVSHFCCFPFPFPRSWFYQFPLVLDARNLAAPIRNQIAVSASGHMCTPTRSTLPPTSCQWHMLGRRNHGKNFVGWRIAGPPWTKSKRTWPGRF